MHSPSFSLPLRAATVTALAALLAAPALRATNGMDLEGYGPIATAMGGASMAYDNGTAAVINNPATLGLMTDRGRLDVALGVLGPDITVTSPASANNIFGVAPNQSAKSTATAFFMPALGYARRSGNLVYGLGVFGQGGMGCEYDPNSWRGLGFGLKNRSEVSVGRVILPLACQVNDRWLIGATADFVWAGMDIQMAMSGAQFFDLAMPTSQQFGRASGTIVQSFGQVLQTMPAGTSVDYAYFNFATSNPFTPAARSYGYGAKIGVVYTPAKALRFGLTYHTPTALADMKADGRTMSFQLNVPGMGHVPQSLAGDYRVIDFQWPALLAGGLAWRPADRWMVVADVREVFWRSVMQQFHMRFTASTTAANGPFAGQSLDAVLFQDWKNQTIVELGAAYEVTEALTLRWGGNFGDNPIPDRYVNCLFPAIIKNHLTAGLGWKFDEHSSLNASFTYGFGVTVTNGTGATISHKQTNAQVMYSYGF